MFVLIPPFRHSLGSRTPWARFLRQRSAVHTEVRALIARRRAAGHLEERTDMLSALLQAGSDDDQLLDESMTLVLAGHDTTATALACAFDLLLHHPAVLERLRAALATDDGDETYLDAVVHEVLRLRPIISEVARKPYEPFAASTGELPAGTNLMASIFLAQDRLQQAIALGPNLHGQCVAFPGIFGEPHGFCTWAIALIPRHRHGLLHPGRVGLTEVVQGRPQGFLDTCQGVQTTDRSEHMRGIGALGSACFDPPMGFTGRQEGVQESLDRLMGQ